MSAGFSGEVAGFYQRYRRGYDRQVVGWLAEAFALGSKGIVLDLGCGTGQLTIPLAAHSGAVIGMDPEPDMLARARDSAAQQGCSNVTWVLGSDSDVPAIARLLGDGTVAVITMANSIHLMDYERLFREVRSLLRPGAGIAVLANGTPLWQQRTAASDALRACLEQWFQFTLTSGCGTDSKSREQYAAALGAAGYASVQDTVLVDYEDVLNLEHVIGSLYSAIPESKLPSPGQRPVFEERIRQALGQRVFAECVSVSVLTGRIR